MTRRQISGSAVVALLLTAPAALGQLRKAPECQLECRAIVVDEQCRELPEPKLANGARVRVKITCTGGCGDSVVHDPLLRSADCGDVAEGAFAIAEANCEGVPILEFRGTPKPNHRYKLSHHGRPVATVTFGTPPETKAVCPNVQLPPRRPPPRHNPMPLPPPQQQNPMPLAEPDEPAEPVRHWDARTGLFWEVGLGPRAAVVDRTDKRGGRVGGTLRVGVHYLSPITGKEWRRDFVRFGPLVTMGAGALLGPSAAVWGNEQGVDLRATIERQYLKEEDGSTGYEFVLHPVLAVSTGRFRTNSLLGSIAPYLGVAKNHDTALGLAFGWGIFPFAYRLTNHLAIDFDLLRLGVRIPFDGELASAQSFTSVSLVFLGGDR